MLTESQMTKSGAKVRQNSLNGTFFNTFLYFSVLFAIQRLRFYKLIIYNLHFLKHTATKKEQKNNMPTTRFAAQTYQDIDDQSCWSLPN